MLKSFQRAILPITIVMPVFLSAGNVQQRQLNGAKPIDITVWEAEIKGKGLSAKHEILTILSKVSEVRYSSRTVTFIWKSASGSACMEEALIETTALDSSNYPVGKAGYGRITIVNPQSTMMVVPLKEITPDAKSVRVRILPKEGANLLEIVLPLKWNQP